MRINSNNLIHPNTVLPTGSSLSVDKGTSFAENLERAAAEVKQKNNPTTSTAKSGEDAKLRVACKEMEAVFLNMMLSGMRATVPKGNLLGNSSQEQMLTSLLDTELTKNMAQAGGMGLADMLYRQLSKSAVKGQAVR